MSPNSKNQMSRLGHWVEQFCKGAKPRLLGRFSWRKEQGVLPGWKRKEPPRQDRWRFPQYPRFLFLCPQHRPVSFSTFPDLPPSISLLACNPWQLWSGIPSSPFSEIFAGTPAEMSASSGFGKRSGPPGGPDDQPTKSWKQVKFSRPSTDME